mmetsp:Transcript_35698/g.38679  ORF Transcript_35698/g.38679 Transcript_35698/m.38679 type:complete len:108 (+) Transcript_35698:604-927(+)
MKRNHNGYGGSYGTVINGNNNNSNNAVFTGSYDNAGYGGNYGGEGYDWNYGVNPLPGPYEMINNNGGYCVGYGNLIHQSFDMTTMAMVATNGETHSAGLVVVVMAKD